MKNKPMILLAAVAFAGWPTQAKAQSTVDLGSASSFAVLAGSGITFTSAVNPTRITGDIGSFSTTTIAGLGTIVLNGTNHAGDASTQAAKNALATAYGDAAGRAATSVGTELGGTIQTPGVYTSATFGITGTLTLDGGGNSNAIFIFKTGAAGTTLITADFSHVVLTGGAQANNVFWQVGSSATLGSSSEFAGNILAQTSITVGIGTTVNGRLLVQDGAVTMDGNNTAGVAPVITNSPLTAAGTVGTPFSLAITATGSPTSYAASPLPAGLVINPTTGVITGTPTAVGTTPVLLSATNATGTGNSALTITIAPAGVAPIITNSPLTAAGTVGTAFSFAITATGVPTSYTATGLPAGLAINATTGAITGTPTTVGTTPVLLGATNAVGTGNAALTITVAPAGVAPIITNSPLTAAGTVGTPFSFTITASGSPTSYDASPLPAGLVRDATTGIISGTPTTAGTTPVLLGATNAVGTGNAALTITVAPAGVAPIITNSPLTAAGTVGTLFSFAITATGVPTSYTAIGLPAGLAINATTGAITGTPTITGTTPVLLGATNAVGTGNAALTITVAPAGVAPIITNSPLTAAGTVGTAFSFAITATGVPTSYTATGLPAGLAINAATGAITGTPTTAGTTPVLLGATNAVGTGNAALTITVAPAGVAPIITNSPLSAAGTVGTLFSFAITATGVPTGYTATGLPAGLAINATTGAITGTPTTVGTTPVLLAATNAVGTGNAALTITVAPAGVAPIITNSPLTAAGTVGTPFSFTITASGSPTSYDASPLPAGLVRDATTGIISGTPTTAGTTPVLLAATNAVGTGNAALTITVAPAGVAPIITNSPLTAAGTVGTLFSFAITATGVPTSYMATGLPAGLAINAATGAITGTPTTAGTTPVLLGATNAVGTGNAALTITVAPAGVAPIITNNPLSAAGTVGTPFSFTTTASGSPTSYDASPLPAGLVRDATTGIISGTPTTAGTTPVLLGATNAVGTGNAALTITVAPAGVAPIITNNPLTAAGTVGTLFSFVITATGVPTSYTAIGLPAGLAINATTGAITGTPTTVGTTPVLLAATNAVGTGNAALTITVAPAGVAPIITNNPLSAAGTVGTLFSFAITATGVPTSYTATGLPAGLAINATTGAITGTPTTVGTTPVLLGATNAVGTGNAALTITVAPAGIAPIITNNPLSAAGTVGTPFSFTITASGSPTSYDASPLPAGLVRDATTGIISGTPTTAGTTPVLLAATNAVGTGNAALTITVAPAGVAPIITNNPLTAAGTVGTLFSFAITATGVPTSYTAIGLPAGLAINATTGAITGTPTTVGTTPVLLAATNAVGTGNAALTITVAPAGVAPIITNSPLTAAGTVGTLFGFAITATGVPTSYTAIGLPTGLAINATTGAITGTPTTVGTTPVLLAATNAVGTGNAALTITVAPAGVAPIITNSPLTSAGTVGAAFSFAITATGVPTSYTATGLPAGLAINPATGAITGTPTTVGTTPVLLGATNAVGTGNAALTITVAPAGVAPIITNNPLTAAGTVGTSFSFTITASGSPTSYDASPLPAGLARNATTGIISGTPTTAGTTPVLLAATNAVGTGNAALTITVAPAGVAPIITNNPLTAAGTVGTLFSFAITATGVPASYTAVGLPAGLAINATTGAITGTPTTVGTTPVLLAATNAVGTGNAALTITVAPAGVAPIITNNPLTAAGTVGTLFSFAITATGVPTSYTAIGLPAGLAINATTGAITGTPTTVGTTPVLLAATNAVGTGNAALTITVAPAGVAPIITNSPLTAAGTVSTAFSFVITATGVPTSYTAIGLPTGLAINAATGAITGTPTTVGTTPVLLGATNAVGTGNAALTITVAPAGIAPIITNNPLTAPGTVGTLFSFAITATGVPTSYTAIGLPAGLAINATTGAITGTPTTVGTTPVLLGATNAVGTGNAALTITVAPAGVAPIITNSPLTAAGTVGTPFSFTITASGSPTSYDASPLPAGLVRDATTGIISGTPTTAGTTPVLLAATNAVGTGNAALTITVAPAGVAPIITNNPLTAPGTVGTLFSFAITATGVPTSYTATGLPAGLAINATTGAITGTPTTAGTTPVLLAATNAVGTGDAALTITVAPAGVAPIITNNPLTAAGTVGTLFSFAITATGVPTNYTAIGLPAGLAINATTGAITGTPTTAGTTPVLLGATNAVGTGNAALTITVAPAGVAPIITNSPLTAAGTVGTLFSFTTTATGVPTSYTAIGLPAGLAINATTGAITGTPTTAGTTPVLLAATNAVGTGNAALTITVAPAGVAPIITNSPLTSAGTVGAAFSFAITATGVPTSYTAIGLPAGLAINTTTGAITGTPSTVGTTPVLLAATNAVGTGNAALTITVAPAGVAPIITNSPLTSAGTVGAAFNFAITATGVPTSYAASPLPAGLVLNAATGAIAGIPTTVGITPVLLGATNAVGTGNVALTITVAPAGVAPIITNNPLTAAGTVGTLFGFAITATGVPTSYTATGLPAGLVINATTGAITGTPTIAGTTPVLLGATNAVGTGNAALTITVAPAGIEPIITNSPLTAAGTVGTAFSFAITATGVPTSYTAVGLPAGLAINATTGAITGTPSTVGTTPVLLGATNAVGTGNAALTITVAPAGVAPIITNNPLTAAGTVGTLFSFAITATGVPTSYTAIGLPAGLVINATTGAITGTPTTAGTTPVLLGATNAVGTGNAALTITVAPAGVAPIITNSPLTAPGTVGTLFSFAITATGVPTSYTAIGLPAGLTINAATGAITGTPTTVGTTPVLLGATNAVGTGNAALTITVAPAGIEPIITNSPLTAAGTVGTLFSFAITATGVPTNYTASPLPAGLVLNAATGAITGTPTTVGATPVLLGATNAVGTGNAALTITVAPAGVAPIITNSPLTSAGTVGTPFSFTMTATGSPTSYAATPLPPGLSINTTTGAITGIPTTAGSTAVLLSATNAVGTGNAALTITVAAAGVAPIITNNPLTAPGTIGTPFSFTMTATGSPTSYAAGPLPAGLSLVTATGTITGTPSAVGTTVVLLSATNAVGTGNATLTITVAGIAPIVTNSPLTAPGTVGTPFSFAITSSDSPTSYAASPLPAGLVFNPTTGAITGTPTTVGTTAVLLGSTNAIGTGNATLSITVAAAGVAPIITNSPLTAPGTVGTPFGFAIAATGSPTSYVASPLPAGLALNPATGAITGTPTTVGTTAVLLGATSATGTGYAALMITVAAAGVSPIVTNSPLTAAGTVGTPFSFAITATGSPTSYAASPLPAGLSLVTATGAITGIPTTPGSTAVLLSATNATGTGNATLTITVAAAGVAPIITNSPLTAAGTVGTPFSFAMTATGSPTSYSAAPLPAGLSLVAATGAITGIPTAVGTTPVLLGATNATGTGYAALTITVAAAGVAPIISNSPLTAAGTVGTPFSFAMTATGSPTSYAAAPLPAGLVLNATTGTITGTPTTVGTTAVLLGATNATGTGNATLTITVAAAGVAPIITNSPLTAAGTVGTPFSFAMTATGSPTSYSATPLPAGLSIVAATGAITGIPTAVGTTPVLLSATNATGTDYAALTITVAAAGVVPIISNSPLTAAGTVGTPFSFAMTATGSPTSYAAAPLPAGLVLNATTGTITGTPTTVGTTAVLLGATNATGTGNATLTITVAAAGVAPIISNSPLTAAGTVGTPFGFTITASGLPTSYAASPLPAGLVRNATTGAITGTPTTAGITAVLLGATNATGTGTATLTITVAVAGVAPIITNLPLTAAGTVGKPYGFSITASGLPTSYAASPLPAGLSIVAATGAITGTPTAAGITAVLLGATNGTGTGNAMLTITVAAAGVAPVITSPTSASGTVGTPLGTYQIAATGSPTSYTATGLPAGLTLNPLTGAINGTPTTAGTFGVTITATNATGTSTATLTISIAPVPSNRIVAFSARALSGPGDQTLIVGFIVAGDNKNLLVRGIGPALAAYNIVNFLADPMLTMYGPNGAVIATNDDWQTDPSGLPVGTLVAATAARVGAFALPNGGKDSALLFTANNGIHTTSMLRPTSTTGVALTEIYDTDIVPSARLTAVSARMNVTTGEGTLIAGFAIAGNAPKTMLIRGVGPALSAFGVTGVLADPQISVYSFPGSTLIASNDNWEVGTSTAAQISTAAAHVGEFPLAAGSKDAALLITLPPGSYTVVVSGVGNTTGVALIEIYDTQ